MLLIQVYLKLLAALSQRIMASLFLALFFINVFSSKLMRAPFIGSTVSDNNQNLLLSRLAQSFSIGYVVLYCENEVSSSVGLVAVGVLLFSSALQTVTCQPSVFLAQRFGMRLRVSMCSLIYQKVS